MASINTFLPEHFPLQGAIFSWNLWLNSLGADQINLQEVEQIQERLRNLPQPCQCLYCNSVCQCHRRAFMGCIHGQCIQDRAASVLRAAKNIVREKRSFRVMNFLRHKRDCDVCDRGKSCEVIKATAQRINQATNNLLRRLYFEYLMVPANDYCLVMCTNVYQSLVFIQEERGAAGPAGAPEGWEEKEQEQGEGKAEAVAEADSAPVVVAMEDSTAALEEGVDPAAMEMAVKDSVAVVVAMEDSTAVPEVGADL